MAGRYDIQLLLTQNGNQLGVAISRVRSRIFWNDAGLFVSPGGFTRDALDLARNQERRKITLIDLDRLVELWVAHYGKLVDRAPTSAAHAHLFLDP